MVSQLGARAAVVLVAGTSAAVLVLEILAGRLLAPYVGVSLETYTGIIGTVLAAIALGTSIGGRIADTARPRTLLGPFLIAGGVLAWCSLPLLSWAGPQVGEGPAAIVVLTTLAFFAPAAVLSAVSPMVAKLRLDDLSRTGEVVGGLSAAGTAGALAGTFVTGFVFVAAWPTRPIVFGIGAVLVAAGALLWMRPARKPVAASLAASLILVSGSAALTDPPVCQFETAYYCITIERDVANASGRVLRMDSLRHSYVDLDDPTNLEFRYVDLFGQVLDATVPDAGLSVLHIGGGGFTFPRWISATRPGASNVVLEIDGELVTIAAEHLGLVEGDGLDVVVGDARLHVDDLPDGSFDAVIGDAFGGLSVPWHLTTREMVASVASSLRPGGVYALNVVDAGPNRFVRAETATLVAEFAHVAVIVPPDGTAAPANFVLVASDVPLDALHEGVDVSDGTVLTGTAVEDFVAGAVPLTDDYAPVDQLLTRR